MANPTETLAHSDEPPDGCALNREYGQHRKIGVIARMWCAAAGARRQLMPTPKGEHRRRETTNGPEARYAGPALASQLLPHRHGEPIRAEDKALVRPYVLTAEERAQQRSAVKRRILLVSPHFDAAELC
ncbi:hypothetical protein [Streptomyces sp. AK02-01A]|uniref:hypothetical protein n=1 Tax=Streptomyces sp. AK02-01A TaxID=3028648 RepID=UPI0029AFC2CC|nr:hypothetical protein [Streptomyces sp. AK02-01A]MDX3855050.1 hypothetical protein [Streptomyces sp. AK02-01A]